MAVLPYEYFQYPRTVGIFVFLKAREKTETGQTQTSLGAQHAVALDSMSPEQIAEYRCWRVQLKAIKPRILRYLCQGGQCRSCFYHRRTFIGSCCMTRSDLPMMTGVQKHYRSLPPDRGISCIHYAAHPQALLPRNTEEQEIIQWLDLIEETDPEQRVALLETCRFDKEERKVWLELIRKGDWVNPKTVVRGKQPAEEMK